jgi:NodT family efflux transporter outer membrane factor (OMF) lipoprotein
MLTLIAEIARNYVELRSTQRRIEIARETLALRQDTLNLFRVQFASELATSLDLARARAALANIQAEIPILTSAGRSAIYRIAVLIGDHPENLLSPLDSSGSIPEASGNVPVGLPSDLLKRRPDIRLAARRIAAANAKIGVAQADLYPHFSLTGLAGLESLSSATFLNPSSFFFSVGPSIKWLIFDAGKVRNQILAERARTDMAAAAYQKTVLGALREVETALVAYGQEQIRREALTQEVTANREALNLAKRLYQLGVEDYLAVLDADRSLHSAEDRLVLSQRDMSINLIALYKSLGGGWENFDRGAIGKSE